MSGYTESATLARRLVARHLMFGLAGVFICISFAAALILRDNLADYAALAAAGALGLLVIGAWVLHNSVQVHQAIEQQLRQLCLLSTPTPTALRPLADSDAMARGWNAMLEQLFAQQAASNLEKRLTAAADLAEGERWRNVFHTLQDGIAVCDSDDCLLLANNAFAALLGLPQTELDTGRKLTDLYVAAVGDRAQEALAAARQSTAPVTLELRKGDELQAGVWRLNRTPVLGDAFGPGASLWTVRDITQQKIAEEMRNQFVYTATHELRTPLTNIKAYAETLSLAEDLDVNRHKSFYNIINHEATRLSRFVDMLLDVSQMEAGAATVSRAETDVERMIQEAMENMLPHAEQKQIKLESQLPPKLPKLRLDKDKMAAALVNLLSNGVKYTPEQGTVRLLVECDETRIDFHIEDTGIGIAAEELPRLCEKFFRSRDSRVQKITGSGLGLAFAREVARRHGGKLTVRSEINKGSRFTLSLPLT